MKHKERRKNNRAKHRSCRTILNTYNWSRQREWAEEIFEETMAENVLINESQQTTDSRSSGKLKHNK